MASDTVHTIEILRKDFTTNSVKLSPERATIACEIQNVQIKPGPNEITIYGLDPDVDLDSIRVTGRGPATITDIQTEVVPQRERFEDVYPDDSDDDDVMDPEDPDDNFGVDRIELTETEKDLKILKEKLETAKSEKATATTSLEFLDSYGKSIKAEDVEVGKLEDYLKVYQKERIRLTDLKQQSESTINEVTKETEKVTRIRDRLFAAYSKARDAAAKSERQEREKKQKAKELKQKEKQRVKNERSKFWPFNLGQVVLHLDGFPNLTPNSSRRNSLIEAKKPERVDPQPPVDTVSLTLTYVTMKATWTPRYELSLKTPTSSGKVVYRAEYHNYSSETWPDTKVVLSTSQTSYSGLNEKIPWLHAWNVKLSKHDLGGGGSKTVGYWKGGLENKTEVNARVARNAPYQSQQKQNLELGAKKSHGAQFYQNAVPQMQMQMQREMQQPQQPVSGALGGVSLFSSNASAPQDGALFGSVGAAVPATRGGSAWTSSRFDRSRDMPAAAPLDMRAGGATPGESEEEDDEGGMDMDTATLSASSNVLAFQESSRQDYGLTTTYDIPGQRTLRPSSLKRRHVIAELDFSSITFSHVVIPKLRPAAFLKARINNSSSVSLLRGIAGLTLDGTFLGTTTVPSCSAKSVFSLALGVDPGIQVTYAKPTVRRATSGFFNKEDCAVFTRVCRIVNTKSTPISIMVLEQVPVSEDERLRVNILDPKGLDKEGDAVKVNAGSESAKNKWGKGVVSMGKGGEIKFQLTIDKGKDIKLKLEYEARIPSGQRIVGLD